jgi:hypothetical protein
MALKCENPVLELLQPRSGIVFTDGGSNTPPFEMKGAPMGMKNPEPLKGVTEWIRKSNATTKLDPKTYFAKENYSEIKLNTENILGGDTDTTLRYEGVSFQHKFTAIHRSLWENAWPEVSLFFTSDDGNMFHICIPIEYTNDSQGENLYLKKWLTTDSTIPNGITTNDIFNFRTNERIKCATLHYCLEYNQGKTTKPYILCIFENKLKVNQTILQPWLKEDNILTSVENKPYRHKIFDEVLCLVLRGTFNKYVMDTPDPFVICDERFFSIKRKQYTVQPAYYNLSRSSLSGVKEKVKEGFRNQLTEGFDTRKLNNIKCYPIDLASQVDDQGNIVIDEITNKPIDPKQVTESGEMDMNVDLEADVEGSNNTTYWIFFGIFLFVLVAFAITFVVFTLRGKSVVSLPIVPIAVSPSI